MTPMHLAIAYPTWSFTFHGQKEGPWRWIIEARSRGHYVVVKTDRWDMVARGAVIELLDQLEAE